MAGSAAAPPLELSLPDVDEGRGQNHHPPPRRVSLKANGGALTAEEKLELKHNCVRRLQKKLRAGILNEKRLSARSILDEEREEIWSRRSSWEGAGNAGGDPSLARMEEVEEGVEDEAYRRAVHGEDGEGEERELDEEELEILKELEAMMKAEQEMDMKYAQDRLQEQWEEAAIEQWEEARSEHSFEVGNYRLAAPREVRGKSTQLTTFLTSHDEQSQAECLDGEDNEVLCPVCMRNNLFQKDFPTGPILCPCGLRLEANHGALHVYHVKQVLATTVSNHLDGGCTERLSFSVRDEFGITTLWGACGACSYSECVI